MTENEILAELTGPGREKYPGYSEIMKTWFDRDIRPLLLSGTGYAEYILDSSRGADILRALSEDYKISELHNFEYFEDRCPGIPASRISAWILIYLKDILGYRVCWNLPDDKKIIIKIF